MEVRVDESQGNSAAFDLVLIDGWENSEWPTCIQVEYSQDQIHYAFCLGLEINTNKPSNHPEGHHGEAYNFLKSSVGETFTVSEEDFAFPPYGPYKKCNNCKNFHRFGYGGDCNNIMESFRLYGSEMIPSVIQKRYAKIEVIVDYEPDLGIEEAYEDWLNTIDLLITDKGVRPISCKLISDHDTNPDEDTVG